MLRDEQHACKEHSYLSIHRRAAENARLFATIVCLGVLLCGLITRSSRAQQLTADVVGTVLDPSGATVPNATIKITNTGTQSTRVATTNAQGEYTFSLLQVGNYSVHAEASGFKSFELAGFTLTVGERRRVDVALTVGAQSDVVQVSTEPPALESDSTTLGTTLGTQSVQDLPTQGRNYYTLVDLAPGANQGPSNGSSSGNRPDDRRQASEVSVNGQSDSRNNNLLDGMDNNTRQGNIVILRPSIDAIQEVSVSTNSYPAELGNTAGAAINVLTKSGTNNFHGSAYEYIRNDALDASDFFAVTKPKYIQNQFGGSLGGPIIRDKTFFFADAEDLRVVQGTTSTVTVPTLYEQQHPGDFSDVGGPVLPTAAINATGLALFNLYPTPTNSGTANNFTSSPNRTQFGLTADGRIDHSFSAKDSMFARFSYNNASTLTPSILPKKNGIYPGGSTFGFEGNADESAYNGMLNYTHIFTPNLIGQAKASYTRFINNNSNLNHGTNVSENLGIPNVNVSPLTSGLSAIYPLGYASLGDGAYIPVNYTVNNFQEAGSVSYSRGRHTLKMGLSLLRRQLNENYAGAYPLGFFVFGYAPGLPYITKNSAANILLGLSLEALRQTQLTPTDLRTWETGAYIQDDWRVTQKLTFNLGLRYDVFRPLHDAKNQLANFNPATASILLASDNNPSAGVKTDYKDFAPRVGFAATLRPTTVVRGAFGMSFYPADTQNNFGLFNPPFLYTYGPAYLTPLNGLPPISAPDINNLSGALQSTAFKFPSSYVEEFNLNLQQQFGQNVLTVAYVGELGRRIYVAPDLNLPTPSPLPNPASRAPFAASLPNVTTIDQNQAEGSSSYNALQVSVARHLSHGFSINGNYTWAHALDDVQNSSSSTSSWGLVPSRFSTYDYGNSDADLRNRFAMSAIYSFPFTDKYQGLKGALLKGWQLNGIAFWQTGQPFTITDSIPQINIGSSVLADRPDQVKKGNISNPSISRAFDTTAYVPQAFGTAGNVQRNSLYGPHQRRVDLSLFREFPLFEMAKLQLRAESYNVSNTPTFGAPNSALNTPGYGTISATLPGIGPRVYQFAGKIIF